MNRKPSCTAIAVLSLLWLLVACTGLGTTPVATPADIPIPVTTPTKSNTPISAAPTQTPTTVQPSQTAAAKLTMTATLPASPAPNAPRIISFSAAPTTTHRLGETISATWEARGTQATLCPYIMSPQGPVEQAPACSDVPLAGTKSITIDENDLTWSGLQLRVTAGQASDRSLVSLHLGCQGFRDWFFSNPPEGCPQAAAVHSPAAAQHFEHGLMIWVKQPDTFYIFYELDQPPRRVFDQISAPYRFRPGASLDHRVGETPPRGMYEPVSGFGQLWRGEIEGAQRVRQRLGWATEPEFSFNTSYQCDIPPFFRLWTCYLAGPDDKVLVLRPDSTAQANFLWDVR